MTTRKVKIVQGLAGYNYSYQAGEIVDLPTELADKWVRKLLAEEVTEKLDGKDANVPTIPAQVEQATSTEQPETASLTTKRKKPGRPRKKTE